MSYLNNVHMVFSGRFQSDVSTVNNDVTHFNNDTFEPRFQEYGNENGWWNPCGSGAFRLIDCRVTQVGYADGSTANTTEADPVIGMLIGGSNERTSAKMVDLDPQMQLVSEIWGLTMRLTDGKTPNFFEGKFLPAPFRDISFSRAPSDGGDSGASAIYQSVLEDLSWVDSHSSPFLQQLKALSQKVGKLSVRMMVYGYNMSHTSPEFTLGHVSGVIGPALEGEPDTFISGRRFAPANSDVTPQNINFFNAQLSPNPNDSTNQQYPYLLNVDFSNALPMADTEGTLEDIGKLQIAILGSDFEEGATGLNPGVFTPLGEPIPYLTPNWLNDTGALVSIPMTGRQASDSKGSPLALIRLSDSQLEDNSPGEGPTASLPDNSILIRETQGGILVRSDKVVHRLNPSTQSSTTFYASQYGVPTALDIAIALQAESQGTSGGPGAPYINHPASAIQFNPHLSIPETGKATFTYNVTDPHNPRGYIDGQLFFLSYHPVDYPNYQQQQYDILANLVFNTFEVPVAPTWADVKDFMTQYGNLYPVMSRMLVDLSDYDSVIKFRALLELAFTLPVSDPNFMPVTRDLSEGKRQTIVKWLTEKDAQGNYVLARGPEPSADKSQKADAREACSSCEIDDNLPTTAQAETPLHTAKNPLSSAPQDSSVMGAKQLANHQFSRSKTRAKAGE